MLKVEGTVGVARQGEDKYTSYINYQITQFGSSDASVEGISMRPVFRGATENLMSAFVRNNGTDIIKVPSKGVIAFEVFGVKNPELAYASYEIMDRYQQVVASVSFPVFVSAAPR
jgi:hypothetical protein